MSKFTDSIKARTQTESLRGPKGDKGDKGDSGTGGGDVATHESTYNHSNYNTAYTHSQTAHAPSDAQKNSDITKAEIEAKLTGEISTHTHAGGIHTQNTDQYLDFGGASQVSAAQGKAAYDHSQVAHAPSNAEQNVNADWNAVSGDAQILNKPTSMTPSTHGSTHTSDGTDAIPVAVAGSTSGLMSAADKTKLDGIASGAEVNVNADWNSVSGDSQILNKPTIPVVSDLAYGSGWNGNTDAPSKNAVYDKIETISGGSLSYSENTLTGDVSIAVANTWYTGATLTLAAGTYLLIGHITIQRTTTTACTHGSRLTDSTVTLQIASGSVYKASVANNISSMTLTGVVVLAGSTTINLQGTCNQTAVIKAATSVNAFGNTATKLVAVRIA